jgi:hypothetical protein
LKDIIFSINLGLIGTEYSRLEIFIDYLKEIALKFTSENLIYEFYLQYEGILIKLRVVIAEKFEDLIQRSEDFKHFDVIIIAVNIYESDSISNYTIQNYSDFRNYFFFNDISVLVGVDTFLIFQKEPPNERNITEINLIQKTRELEFLYCFKIQDIKKDVSDIFSKVLNYINLKLQFLNPELFKRAKLNSQESNGQSIT